MGQSTAWKPLAEPATARSDDDATVRDRQIPPADTLGVPSHYSRSLASSPIIDAARRCPQGRLDLCLVPGPSRSLDSWEMHNGIIPVSAYGAQEGAKSPRAVTSRVS
ncbi:hypothetical protein NEUTE1DRAFT_142507 [Neurospora tetrasperma FGSC 2508]|uniref:Uncharacterized protein n=1 Tax=Neurospora tetrasperma (strain FGSC 2508 / ATCC MYA-4615 / P0657) TaxID=510951 RepID=F8N3Y4_NEUT8|nr:uncharacterized protein NEUTE1DRAFT_142507 [Neurospora tetrasperma FGSC 2508]EGO52631.1 hypothetical protein NEUTE1DRAFT_142507 [Neurospora tetrasperma FGSC 2508]